MASGPQVSAISFLGASAEPSRPSSASSANTAANSGADRPGGGFQVAMKQAAQRQPATKNTGADHAAGKDRPTHTQDAAANTEGKALPRDGVLLPEEPLAELGDADEAQNADDKDAADAEPVGIMLFSPLTANTLANTNALTGAAKTGAAAPSGVLALGGNAPAKAQAGAGDLSAADASGDNGEAVTGKSAALPGQGAVAGAGDKPATLDDQDFSSTLKQLDAASPTPGHGAQAESTRELATRQYQNTSGATTTVQVPVGKPGWSDAVLDKVMWMSSQQLNSAEIHLNPPDLGPLQVRISTQHDQASVLFTSQHAAVRDALDQALPKLRDMLDSQGIQLLDAGVGGQQGSAAQQQQAWRGESGGGAQPGRSGYGGDETAAPASGALVAVRVSNSLVDAYA